MYPPKVVPTKLILERGKEQRSSIQLLFFLQSPWALTNYKDTPNQVSTRVWATVFIGPVSIETLVQIKFPNDTISLPFYPQTWTFFRTDPLVPLNFFLHGKRLFVIEKRWIKLPSLEWCSLYSLQT